MGLPAVDLAVCGDMATAADKPICVRPGSCLIPAETIGPERNRRTDGSANARVPHRGGFYHFPRWSDRRLKGHGGNVCSEVITRCAYLSAALGHRDLGRSKDSSPYVYFQAMVLWKDAQEARYERRFGQRAATPWSAPDHQIDTVGACHEPRRADRCTGPAVAIRTSRKRSLAASLTRTSLAAIGSETRRAHAGGEQLPSRPRVVRHKRLPEESTREGPHERSCR